MAVNDYMGAAAAMIDPSLNTQVAAGKTAIRGLRAGTGRQLKSVRSQLPLIRQRYVNLIKEIANSQKVGQGDIKTSQENQLGSQLAQSASRGNYGGSVEDSQATNTRATFAGALTKLLTDIASQKRGAVQDRNTSEQQVKDKVGELIAGYQDKRGSLNTQIAAVVADAAKQKIAIATQMEQAAQEKARWEADMAEKQREFAGQMAQARAAAASSDARWRAEMANSNSQYAARQAAENAARGRAETGSWVNNIANNSRGSADMWNKVQNSSGAMRSEYVNPNNVLSKLSLKYRSGPNDYMDSSGGAVNIGGLPKDQTIDHTFSEWFQPRQWFKNIYGF